MQTGRRTNKPTNRRKNEIKTDNQKYRQPIGDILADRQIR